MWSSKQKQRINDIGTPARSNENLIGDRDPVSVYCRLRPTQRERDSDSPCMELILPSMVLLTPPRNRNENAKTMNYIFKEVFPPETNQQEVFDKVALPMVEGLIKGKDGLLFTYGVTGSGKTFTMTGEPQNYGILPRCLNIIFKTINKFQTHKYILKPDTMNMFDIQTEAKAMLERQQELHKLKSGSKKHSNPDLAMSSSDVTKIEGIIEDNHYAVFVTYVAIYNNSVFDLLEYGPISKNLPAKIICEDAAHKIYVHGATEVEIKSTDEAFEAFHLGLKRKRIYVSSRSHSVFTIRLVQAPVDEMGEAVIQNRKLLCISQLSFVDLAGSELTAEAGNINKSLMTLRTCLELLRENQITSGSNKIPYRESMITYLFKSFFEGEGQVRMVVCINPRAEDYDETLQVMSFAEVAGELEVAKPKGIDIAANIGLTSGCRKVIPEAEDLEMDLGLVSSPEPDFPSLELNGIEDYLETLRDYRKDKFWVAFMELNKTISEVLDQNVYLQSQLEVSECKVKSLEERLTAARNASLTYERKLNELTENRSSLERDMVLTCGGNAQVIFYEAEMPKQFSLTQESSHSHSNHQSGTNCATHSGKRRDRSNSPPQTPSNTSKQQRLDDDRL